MNMLDQIVRSMARGYGFGLGRRAANRMPLWITIVVILGLYLVAHAS